MCGTPPPHCWLTVILFLTVLLSTRLGSARILIIFTVTFFTFSYKSFLKVCCCDSDYTFASFSPCPFLILLSSIVIENYISSKGLPGKVSPLEDEPLPTGGFCRGLVAEKTPSLLPLRMRPHGDGTW